MSHLYIVKETFTNGFWHVLLDALGLTSILSGILVVITKNPIVSVLFLIALFLIISIYLIVLGMSFIGLSYLLVYIGAVSILFIFILMLINIRISELTNDNNNSVFLAVILGLLFNYSTYQTISYQSLSNYRYTLNQGNNINNVSPETAIYSVLSKDNLSIQDTLKNILFNTNYSSEILGFFRLEKIAYVTSSNWDNSLSEIPHITAIGNVMYTNYFIWLILTSIILLAAMVGTIVITIRQKH